MFDEVQQEMQHVYSNIRFSVLLFTVFNTFGFGWFIQMSAEVERLHLLNGQGGDSSVFGKISFMLRSRPGFQLLVGRSHRPNKKQSNEIF